MSFIFDKQPITNFHLNTTPARKILLLFLALPLLGAAQNYQNQEGISLGGGISSMSRYSGFLKSTSESDVSQYQTFSWDAGLLRIKRLNQFLAFSHGLSIQMLGRRWEQDREIWNPGKVDSVPFAGNKQQLESYSVTLPFRWSFYLNRRSSGGFFLGPGILLTIPVFQVLAIRGNDLNGQYHDIVERRFPQKGPYAFLCPELECGWLFEFPDCSMARFSLFSTLRAPGFFKVQNTFGLQHYSGFRFAWFFGNS